MFGSEGHDRMDGLMDRIRIVSKEGEESSITTREKKHSEGVLIQFLQVGFLKEKHMASPTSTVMKHQEMLF